VRSGILAGIAVSLVAVANAAEEPLSSIAAVKEAAMAAGLGPVRIGGVVTLRQGEGFVIQDESAGIWVDVTNARSRGIWRGDDRSLDAIAAGAAVEVLGETSRGGFAPTVQPAEFRVLGERALPESLPADSRRFFSGGDDCLRVTVAGVVRRVELERHEWGEVVSMLVCTDGRCSRVTIPREAVASPVQRLLDAEVRCTGVATARFNARGEILTPMLHMLGRDDLVVERMSSGGPFDAPPVGLAAIAQYRPAELDEHRLRTRGVVTMSRPGEFVYLQDGCVGIRVQTAALEQFEAGDVVEAAGFVDRGRLCAALVEAEVRRVERGTPPEPLDVAPARVMEINRVAAATFSVAVPGDYFGALVRMSGRLVDMHATARGAECLISSDDNTVVVVADGATVSALRAIGIGSTVAVTGVLRPVARAIEDPMSPAWISAVERLEILPRTPADVRVLAVAPWWTPRRLSFALIAAAATAAGAVLWGFLLRRQIAAQLRIIRGQLEARATQEERQRIAREFHDTLEQDLASIALQVDAAEHCAEDEDVRRAFAEHRAVMARLRQETHDFLWDLRDPRRCDGSLAESLAAQAAYLRSLSDVPIICQVADDLPKVPADVQFHLLRIVREAVRNAVEHADPARVEVVAGCEAGGVTVVIADDGCGFTPQSAESRPGHFGIVGMRERARRIGATVGIESHPGRGTRIRVTWTGPGIPAGSAPA
jgi:signal transduction histidine kinase